jgi:hypothetical protein
MSQSGVLEGEIRSMVEQARMYSGLLIMAILLRYR